MKKRMLLGLLLLAAPLAALNTSGDIILAHFADGLQWTTTFTIVNLDTAQASYTLYFYDDNGNPLSLSVVVAGAVSTGTSSSGVLAVNGSAVIQTKGGGSGVRQGWARLTSSQKLGAQAVFVEHTSVADYEAAVPVGLVSNAFRIAFDNTNGYFTGVAISNWDQLNPVTVIATFRDQTGGQIVSAQAAIIKPFGHTSLLLNLTFPTTAGRIGSVDIGCASFCSISGLGLRFSPNNGPFTSTSAFGL